MHTKKCPLSYKYNAMVGKQINLISLNFATQFVNASVNCN